MDFIALEAFVRQQVDEHRFTHLLETSRLAQELGGRFAPQHSAFDLHLVSLWHDVVRNWRCEELLSYAKSNNLNCEAEEWHQPQLLHAPVAAALLPQHCEHCTVTQVKAIRWHTLGSIEMGSLGAILFVADAAEVTRSFSQRSAILRESTLPEMVIAAIEQTRDHLYQKAQLPLAHTTLKLLEFLQAGGQFA